MKNVLLILSCVIIFSCSKNSDPVSVDNGEAYFGIYFLQDTSITEQEISNLDINSIDLNNEPWLSDNDIKFYDYSTHCIYLNKDKSYFFKNYGGRFYQFNPALVSKPFVVVAGTERCYFGALHSGFSSLAPTFPYMDEIDVGSFPDDVMHISRAWSNDEDIRSNPKIAEVLIKQNLYHPGLDIELTLFQIVNNSDTSTVEYSITITNNDQENLYIIDPAKMGSELFHYFTNGPHLRDYNKSLYLYSQYKQINPPDPYDSWNFDWFTLIKSNQSIERTIQLKGYPYIPNGNYMAYMNFSNPKNINKNSRIVAGGRIWIGTIRSNDLEINL